MIELGHWERGAYIDVLMGHRLHTHYYHHASVAVAIAPCVSVEFWRSQCTRYAQHLWNKDNEQAEPFLLAANDMPKVVEWQLL